MFSIRGVNILATISVLLLVVSGLSFHHLHCEYKIFFFGMLEFLFCLQHLPVENIIPSNILSLHLGDFTILGVMLYQQAYDYSAAFSPQSISAYITLPHSVALGCSAVFRTKGAGQSATLEI
jgi:hypothetical protein